MDSAGFAPTRWDHWLLIVSFVGIAAWGLWLSHQWRREAIARRQRAKLARRLALELHGPRVNSPVSPSALYGSDEPGVSDRLPRRTQLTRDGSTRPLAPGRPRPTAEPQPTRHHRPQHHTHSS